MWPLLGIAVLVGGFALRLNPLLVVVGAVATTGLLAGFDPLHVLAAYGKAFNDNRLVAAVWLVLPVIGLLERYGLQARARKLVAGMRQATVGRLLLAYLIYRQITAALGLIAAGGQAQMVRPLVAPMAEAAAEAQAPQIKEPGALDRLRALVRAHAAAVDNIGVFFGEDIFLAMSSIVLIKGFLDGQGIQVAPLQLSVWAIPTAIAAFLIHGARLMLLDRRIKRIAAPAAGLAAAE
jgi:uncharacterized membrane protein